MSVQVFVIDSICMYPHCTVRIRLLYAFNKCFYFDLTLNVYSSLTDHVRHLFLTAANDGSIKVRLSFINPFTADPVKALHFAMLV